MVAEIADTVSSWLDARRMFIIVATKSKLPFGAGISKIEVVLFLLLFYSDKLQKNAVVSTIEHLLQQDGIYAEI